MKNIKVIGRKIFSNNIHVANILGERDPKRPSCSGFWIQVIDGQTIGKVATCKGSFAYMADAASYIKNNSSEIA